MTLDYIKVKNTKYSYRWSIDFEHFDSEILYVYIQQLPIWAICNSLKLYPTVNSNAIP